MAKETPQPNPSLLLHQVLEEEFQHLHGFAPPGNPSATTPESRLKEVWSAVHGLDEKQAALCISGGGVRSATFALGVLQGLSRCGLLQKFHYLSTVSGGGYIGGWLTAWIHNSAGGIDEVTAELAQPRTETRPNPEPAQIQNLRSYSNYLSPRLGLFSADAWTLIGTYLRNLLLNWLVLIPLLMAALTVPWIYTAIIMQVNPPDTRVLLLAGGFFICVGVAYMGLNLPCGGNKRWNQNRFLLFCLAPLVCGSVLMTIHWAWFTNYGGKTPAWPVPGMEGRHLWPAFALLGVVLHLLSWAGSLLRAHGFRFMEFLAVIATGAIGGILLWLGALKLFEQPLEKAELYSLLAVPLFLALFFLSTMAFAGISSRWTSDEDREWWGRATGWLLVFAAGWLVVSGLVLFGPLLFSRTVSMVSTLGLGGIAGALSVLAGRTSRIPANEKQAKQAGPLGHILAKASSIAAAVFIAVLMVLLIKITTGIMQVVAPKLGVIWNLGTVSWVVGTTVTYLNVILYTPAWLIVSLAAALVGLSLAMAYLINPNKFSLHAMYRDRLIRAYLGASNKERAPHPFTGFDARDNKAMRGLWPQEKFGGKLLPVVNIALNLVGGSKLAWQERKAASFTISPFHCGSCAGGVGYRKTEAPDGQRYGGEISLGTAMTISGAAASPNMGYHSSPLVTFIMSLLNVRLGAWLGNPATAGDKTFHLSYPKFSVWPMIAEALGLTNETNPYVYLSDGGHFENLGLYEMVLRRCHYIVVSDAGEDPACSFADLGGAVRKIRIDLGISIEFSEISIYGRGDDALQNEKGRHAAVGRIRYSEVDGEGAPDGVIVYLKPACYGNEPRDIYEYFKSNEAFPHESTTDQFFTESQFESYRMLGIHTMERLCEKSADTFPEFVQAVIDQHLKTSAPEWLETALAGDTPRGVADKASPG